MAILFNENPNPQNIIYNGNNVQKVIYNGLASQGTFVNNRVVWDKTPKVITKIYDLSSVTGGGWTYMQIYANDISVPGTYTGGERAYADYAITTTNILNGLDVRFVYTADQISSSRRLRLIVKVDGRTVDEISGGSGVRRIDYTRNLSFTNSNIIAIRFVSSPEDSYVVSDRYVYIVREIDIQTISSSFFCIGISRTNNQTQTPYTDSYISFNGIKGWKSDSQYSSNDFVWMGGTYGDMLNINLSKGTIANYVVRRYASLREFEVLHSYTGSRLICDVEITQPDYYRGSTVSNFPYDVLQVWTPSYESSTNTVYITLQWLRKTS